VHKSLIILERISESGGATARDVAEELGIPLPTVYRLAKGLERDGYLVHVRHHGRFELGHKLLYLGVALQRQVRINPRVRSEVASLKGRLAFTDAAYFFALRGTDSAIGFQVSAHGGRMLSVALAGRAHATAIGKVVLANLDAEQRQRYLDLHGCARFTDLTVVDPATLDSLFKVGQARAVHWEIEEYEAGRSAAALAVHDAQGELRGVLGVSCPPALRVDETRSVGVALRETCIRIEHVLRGADS